MSEQENRAQNILLAAALAAGGLLVAGCDAGGASSDLASQPVIPRCYDAPQPAPRLVEPAIPPVPAVFNPNTETFDQYMARSNAWEKKMDAITRVLDGPPTLNVPIIDGFAQGDPIYNETLVDNVTESIVQIKNKEWSGTGWLTTDSKGREVVVTAAHVVGDAKLQSLKITTNDGQETHADGGCYIFDNNGKHSDLKKSDEEGVQDSDIAVLTLPKAIGGKTLRLSQGKLSRGAWETFVNYQADHSPGNPAFYTGVVATTQSDLLGVSIVTGVKQFDHPLTIGDVNDYMIQGGASGGPVVNNAGQVVGVSTSGTKEDIYLDANDLKSEYNIAFPGAKFGDNKGFAPAVAGVMPVSLIKLALNAPAG